jgi:hypothetical protein
MSTDNPQTQASPAEALADRLFGAVEHPFWRFYRLVP